MKKMVIIGGVSLVLIGLAAFVVAGKAGHHEAPVDWKSKRGTEAYYTSELLQYELKDMTVNLKGADAKYFQIGLAVAYRVGPELPEPKKPFSDAELALKDRLTLLLSNKTPADIEGKEKLTLLKQEILDEVQAVVFPEKTGRVEQIYLTKTLSQ